MAFVKVQQYTPFQELQQARHYRWLLKVWSLGTVHSVYWHSASVGEHFLGCIIAGLDPNHPSFGFLPQHWTTSNSFENNLIKRATVGTETNQTQQN